MFVWLIFLFEIQMCSKVLQPGALVVLFETLLSSAATTVDEDKGNPSWQACADFYMTCILSCLPWGGAELVEVNFHFFGHPPCWGFLFLFDERFTKIVTVWISLSVNFIFDQISILGGFFLMKSFSITSHCSIIRPVKMLPHDWVLGSCAWQGKSNSLRVYQLSLFKWNMSPWLCLSGYAMYNHLCYMWDSLGCDSASWYGCFQKMTQIYCSNAPLAL